MSLPGVSAGVAGDGGGGGGGGGGSTGDPYRVAAYDAAGNLGDGPQALYRYVVDAGNDLAIEYDLELGGLGSIVYHIPRTPTTAGQPGFNNNFFGGIGAAGAGATPGGVGGDATLGSGRGGAGTALAAAGKGGDVYLLANQAGVNGGGGGGAGGNVYVDAGLASGAAASGDVFIGTQGAGAGLTTRRVQVGPAAGTVVLLGNKSAPVGAELLNLNGDTDVLHIIGRTAIGSWVAADEMCLGHYDYRASATGYTLRANAAGTSTVINVPAAGNLYMLCAGSTSLGWRIDFTTGAAHFLPGADNAHDIGSASARARDVYTSRDVYVGDDVEFLRELAHDCGVATSTTLGAAGGALNVYAGTGRAASGATAGSAGGALTLLGGTGGDGASGLAPGSGGMISVIAGSAGTRVNSGNPNGGRIDITAGTGRQAGGGGSVNVTAGSSGPGGTAGSINLVVGDADGVYGAINIASSVDQRVGFYGATAVAKQTGVAVTAAGIHAALTSLGLIS